MFVPAAGGLQNLPVVSRFTAAFFLALAISAVISAPVFRAMGRRLCPNGSRWFARLGYLLLWGSSVVYLSGLAYNPFIYLKF